ALAPLADAAGVDLQQPLAARPVAAEQVGAGALLGRVAEDLRGDLPLHGADSRVDLARAHLVILRERPHDLRRAPAQRVLHTLDRADCARAGPRDPVAQDVQLLGVLLRVLAGGQQRGLAVGGEDDAFAAADGQREGQGFWKTELTANCGYRR